MAPPIAVADPLVFGHRMSRSSVDFIIFNIRVGGFKTISGTDELNPGLLYGNGPKIMGRTRGRAKHSFSVELFEEEWLNVVLPRARLLKPGAGYGEGAGQILTTFFEPGTIGVHEVEVVGARIMKVNDPIPDSEEGLTVKLDFSVQDILRDGTSIVNNRSFV